MKKKLYAMGLSLAMMFSLCSVTSLMTYAEQTTDTITMPDLPEPSAESVMENDTETQAYLNSLLEDIDIGRGTVSKDELLNMSDKLIAPSVPDRAPSDQTADGIVMPFPEKSDESVDDASLSVTNYLTVNSVKFSMDTDKSGSTWDYYAKDHLLVLENYVGGPITATDKLNVLSYGTTIITGKANSTDDSVHGICCDSDLYLYNYGTLTVNGGKGSSGGDSVRSWFGSVYVINYSDGRIMLTGGESTNDANGSNGINAEIMVRLYGKPDSGRVDVVGGKTQTVSGYNMGGHGILSAIVILEANCWIKGGDGYFPGCGIYYACDVGCCRFVSTNATIGIGGATYSTGATAVVGYNMTSGAVGNAYFDLVHSNIYSGSETSSKVIVKRNEYTLTIDGNGGTLNGKSKYTLKAEYPTSYDLLDYVFTRSGYVQYGWTASDDPSVVLPLTDYEGYVPEKNITLKAAWISAAPGDIIFCGVDGKFDDGAYVRKYSGVSYVDAPNTLEYDSQYDDEMLDDWSTDYSFKTDTYGVRNGTRYYRNKRIYADADKAIVLYGISWRTTKTFIYYPGEVPFKRGGDFICQEIPSNEGDLTVTVLGTQEFDMPKNYTLLGWTDSKDSTEVKYKVGSKLTYPYSKGSDMLLYPIWKYNGTPVESVAIMIDGEEYFSTRLFVGDSLSLTASVLPANATDKSVVWSSSDPKVATVSQAGVVRAIAPGFASITATAQGQKKDTVWVYVYSKYSVTIDGNGGTRDGKTKLTWTPSSVNDFFYSEEYVFARNGYVQVGWTISTEPTETQVLDTDFGVYRFPDEYECPSSVTFKAVWESVKLGDVILFAPSSFAFEDGSYFKKYSGADSVSLSVNCRQAAYDEAAPVSLWCDAISFSVDDAWYSEYDAITPDADVVTVLYGFESPMPHFWFHPTVGKIRRGGTVIMGHSYSFLDELDEGDYFPSEEEIAALIEAPAHYKFAGWALMPDSDEIVIYAGESEEQSIERLLEAIGELPWDLDLYAVWEPDGIPASSVSFSESGYEINAGESFKPAVTVLPDNATDKTVEWTSSDTSVFTVSADGTVTAVADGTAILTATSVFGDASATCTVTVKTIPTITVVSAKGKAGSTVNVTLALANNPGIVSMLLNVGYDSSALTLTSVTDAGVLGSQSHSNDLTLSPYVLYWNNGSATENYVVNGTIVTLSFKIKDGAEEKDYPITVSYDKENDAIFNVDFTPVEFETVNGKVTVCNTICGDVNGDGKVTAMDNAYLSRYFAKWTGYDATVVDLSAADTNNDGKVTALDNAVLARHLAKWTGYDVLPYKN